MFHNKRLVVIIMIMAVSSTLIAQQLIGILQVYASESSPYQSGYDHGCDDAGISDPGDRYINQPEKGPSFHTGEFMSGYNAGFGQCGSNDRGGDEGNGQSGGPSTADKQDFCTAYNRGDYDDLKDLARDFGLGSVNAAARLWCSLTGSN